MDTYCNTIYEALKDDDLIAAVEAMVQSDAATIGAAAGCLDLLAYYEQTLKPAAHWAVGWHRGSPPANRRPGGPRTIGEIMGSSSFLRWEESLRQVDDRERVLRTSEAWDQLVHRRWLPMIAAADGGLPETRFIDEKE